MSFESWAAADLSFSRFTRRARNAVMSAHNQAAAAGNDTITIEHLVLGLLDDPDSLGAQAIAALGAPTADLRSAVAAGLPPAAVQVPVLIPYHAAARKVLELTVREALRLGHNYVGTEHLLLALLEHEAGAGYLAGIDLDKGEVEAHVAAAVEAVRKAQAARRGHTDDAL
jgi:ATP-dependent Clp protease ATP-binding subunit ClpA